MTEKIRHAFYTVSNAALLAGVLIFITGAYYGVVKAGIPYQDPPLNLQIQYAVYLRTGDELLRLGFFTILYGTAFRLVYRLAVK